jgi:signal transduction histidine kinase
MMHYGHMMTFRGRVAIAFTALVVVLVLAAVSALVTLRLVVRENQHIVEISDDLSDVLDARVQAEQVVAVARRYLLTGSEQARQQLDDVSAQLGATLRRLEEPASEEERRRLSELSHVAEQYVAATRTAARPRVWSGSAATSLDVFENQIQPLRAQFERAADSFVAAEKTDARASKHAARTIANRAQIALVVLVVVALALALGLVWVEARTLVSQYRRVERATESARQAAAARDDLLAMVSHDLKTPLTAVAMGTDLLAESGVRPEQQRTVRAISSATERMRRLIDGLLEREQLQSGAIELDRATCDASELVATALELHREQAHKKHVELKTDVQAGQLHVDRERLLRAFSNLIGNALKFTGAGGSITIRAHALQNATRFEIEDTGTGIPAEQLPDLFDKFFQGERRERGSVGLGLHITKRIVEAHGGSIGVESSVGRGTTFWFTIPS